MQTTKKEGSDAGFQKKLDSSSQAQLKTPSELKQLRKAEKGERSLSLQSSQGKGG